MDILFVEDDDAIAETVIYALQQAGHTVTWCATAAAALAAADAARFAIAVLDVGLPDQSGFELYQALQRRAVLPALFLTARNDEIDRIVGLELGAEDYISKPFSPRELVLRIRAILRRQTHDPIADTGLFVHRPEQASIQFAGHTLVLTASEYRILACLLRQPARVFSREQLLNELGAASEDSTDRAVDTLIKQIRAKLRAVRADVDPIVTHRGFGYSLRGSN